MEGYITEKGGCYLEDRYWFFRLRDECKAVGVAGPHHGGLISALGAQKQHQQDGRRITPHQSKMAKFPRR